jgi:trehalose 6-phosphate synthase
VNGKYADLTWTPIRYIHRTVPRSHLAGLLRASQAGLVTPLRHGMNLVAKEYMADAIAKALAMPLEERIARHGALEPYPAQ